MEEMAGAARPVLPLPFRRGDLGLHRARNGDTRGFAISSTRRRRTAWSRRSISALHVTKSEDFDALVERGRDDGLRACPVAAARGPPTWGGRSRRSGAGRISVRALSPDGRFLAVFSQVDPFSFSLALVDAATGEGRAHPRQHGDRHALRRSAFRQRVRRLVARLAAFRVSRSAGRHGGHCDCRRSPAAASSGSSRSRRFPDVSGLAWSPLGGPGRAFRDAGRGRRAVAPAACNGDLKRLTTGRAAFLQPSWSPDGTTHRHFPPTTGRRPTAPRWSTGP